MNIAILIYCTELVGFWVWVKGAEYVRDLMEVTDVTRENLSPCSARSMNDNVFALKEGVFIPLKSFTKYFSIFLSAPLLVGSSCCCMVSSAEEFIWCVCNRMWVFSTSLSCETILEQYSPPI